MSLLLAALAAYVQPWRTASTQHGVAPVVRASRAYVVAAASEDELARAAGRSAVMADINEQKAEASSARKKDAGGRAFTVTLPTKPLGVVLATNPSGRGVFVSDILEGSAAAATGKLKPGDFVTEVCIKGPSFAGFKASWKGLDEVLQVIEETPAPLTLRVRRGGPEPWSLERDGSGLSVEEMVQTTKQQYGRLLDDAQEDALRTAFAEIKEGEKRAAAQAASSGGFESDSLQSLSRFEFELRSFAQGARDALEQVQQFIYNRALLDSKLAVQTAEYLLRRAIFDSGRILSAASSAVAVLGAAPSSPNAGAAAPFERMLSSISSTRALSGAPTDDARLEAATARDAEELSQREADEAAEAARAALRAEAAALLAEAIGGVEAWARQAATDAEQAAGVAAANETAPAEATAAAAGAAADLAGFVGGLLGSEKAGTRVEEPDWEELSQRAGLLGGDVAVGVREGLETVRRDFAAFQSLQRKGQLPTLIEQLAEPSTIASGSVPVRAGGVSAQGRSTLGAFGNQASPVEQRQQLQKRRQSEMEAKQLKLAARVGQRASKDSADAIVYGVLPSAKAVGRMAARRVAQRVADQLGTETEWKKGGAKGGGGTGAAGGVGLVGELAEELAQAYKEDLKRGAEMGPLADLVDAVKGPTQKMAQDLTALGGVINKALESEKMETERELSAAKEGLPAAETSASSVVADTLAVASSPPKPLGPIAALQQRAKQKRERLEALKRGEQPPVAEASAPPPPPTAAAVRTPRSRATDIPAAAAAGMGAGFVDVDVEASVEVFGEEAFGESLRSAGGEEARRSGARVGGRAPPFDEAGGLETFRGAAGDEEGVLEAVDVSVTAVEADEEEQATQRKAVFIDAFFLSAEAALGTLFTNTFDFLTPEEARSWELLNAFKGQGSPVQQKAARAKEKLLDELSEGVARR